VLCCSAHDRYTLYHNQNSKVQLDYFGLQLAAGVAKAARQRGALFLQIDFAARMDPDRGAECTGVFKDTCNVLVMYFTHDFRLQKVSDLPRGQHRSRLEKEKVESYHTADSTVVYLYSNAKNNAHYYGKGLFEALAILAKGELPAGAVGDWVHNGVRIKGSKPSGSLECVFPPHINGKQLEDFNPGVHTLCPLVKALITALIQENDGCGSQFKCKDGHRVTQQLGLYMAALLGRPVVVSRTTDVPEEGKGKADGAIRVPTAAITNARRAGISALDNTVASRALFVEAARAAKVPNTPRIINPGLYAHTNYVHGWIPDDFSAEYFTATERYPDSSLDFWHGPHIGNKVESDAWLQVRHQPCFCANCLGGDVAQCLVPDLVKSNGVRNYQLPRAADLPIVAKARAATTRAHAVGLKLGTTVVARVHPHETAARVDYHLALCLSKPFPLSKAAVTRTNGIKRGTIVVKMRWLYRARGRDSPGQLAYEIPEGEKNEVWPVECTVASCHEAAQLIAYDKEAPGRLFHLPVAAHGQILSTGVDLLA
jgi:hypothetical protein